MPAFFLVGFPIIKAAFISLRSRSLNMDVMYSLGISVALLSSLLATFGVLPPDDFIFYDTVIMLAAFLSLGRYLEEKAKGKTSQALRKLIGLVPKNALVQRENGSVYVPIDEIMVDDIVIIKPGDRIPVDGEVISGVSYADESTITGESNPVKKSKGDSVISGSINISSTIRFSAKKVGKETMLNQIIRLVEEAQGSKPPIQKLADTVVSYFIPVILAIAVSAFLVWYFIVPDSPVSGNNLLLAINSMIAILVVACPCALGLATPTAVTVGIGKGAELGILIKNGNALEIAEKIDTAVFDKTGTITVGKPVVRNIINFSIGIKELLFYLASVEGESQHPIADAIVEKAGEYGIKGEVPSRFETVDGMGVYGLVDGKEIYIGKREYIEKMTGKIPEDISKSIDDIEGDSNTIILASVEGKPAGILTVSDRLRKTAGPAVKILSGNKISIHMLTGDNKATAEAICRKAGIKSFVSDMLPGQKAEFLKDLQRKGHKVAFIGDGINDAPALAVADLGIAVGNGTDIAIETGDIVLAKNNLLYVPVVFELSRKIMDRIRKNIFWAFLYNMLLIPVAFGLLYPFTNTIFRPEYAGFAMAMSSFTVVSLSLLLKRYKPSFSTNAEELNLVEKASKVL